MEIEIITSRHLGRMLYAKQYPPSTMISVPVTPVLAKDVADLGKEDLPVV